jgi:hypothetical protein
MVRARGMTGGMSSGVPYFGMSLGSRDEPEIGTARTTRIPPAKDTRNNPAPAAAEPTGNRRLDSSIEGLLSHDPGF